MALAFDSVEVVDLLKMFGTTRALVGVSTHFKAGTVTVVEGHNGSGKSTLVRILAQLARPTRGRIRYGSMRGRAARAHIGLLAHASMLYPDLDARENLSFFAGLYGLGPAEVTESITRFDLHAIADRPVRTYSRGQLQRAALARAVISKPTLLLLDEPSTGLDRSSVERLEALVAEERSRGAIVVVVSHDDSLAGRIADRRLTLERGRVVAS